MSRNSKYYQKKLPSAPEKGYKTIDVFFGKEKLDTSNESRTVSPPSPATQPDDSVIETSNESRTVSPPSPATQPDDSVIETSNESRTVSPLSPATQTDDSVIETNQIDKPNVDKGKQAAKKCYKRPITVDYGSQYEWLYYNSAKKAYLCKTCEMFKDPQVSNTTSSVDSPFVSGTQLGDHPVRKLDKHLVSNAHERAVVRHVSFKSGDQSSIPSCFKQKPSRDTDRNRAYMEALVDTVYLVVKKHWALDSVPDVMNHLHNQQCPAVGNYMKQSSVIKYTSSTSITDVLASIGTHFERILIESINKAKYIALLADESTDEANRTQFAVLIRYLKDSIVDDHFLGMVNVKKTDAASLMEELERFVTAKGIDISKVMFVGFDGCNTMSGVHKGLQRRFRHKVPHSIYINCRSHRLALCVKHLIKDFPVLEEVDCTLLLIFKLFDNSPQKFAVFKDVQDSYAMKELVLVRASATRWLSHGNACVRLIDRYVQIIDTLDHLLDVKKDPELTGIREAIMAKQTTAAILILCDILHPVNIFCKYLQGSVDFSTVTVKLKELIDTLHGMVDQFRATLHGPNELHLSKAAHLFEEIDERTVYSRRLRDRNVYTPEQVVDELAVPMVYKLIQELEDGFHCSPVLDAFSILNKSRLPDTIGDLADYGTAAIQTLSSHYGTRKTDQFLGQEAHAPPLFDKTAAEAEFQAFKHQMFMIRRRQPDTCLLQQFVQDPVLCDTFPCMHDLVLLGKLIPTSTASVERCFSLMNSICTVNRNRLNQETLTALMLICREGPNVLTSEQKTIIVDNFKRMKRRDIAL